MTDQTDLPGRMYGRGRPQWHDDLHTILATSTPCGSNSSTIAADSGGSESSGPLTDRRAIPTMRGSDRAARVAVGRSRLPSRPGSAMPAFTHHVFVCGNVREPGPQRGCCDPDGHQALRDAFKEELKKAGFGPLARANHAGCLEQCEHGPTVVIYPQGSGTAASRSRTSPGSWPGRSSAGEILNDLADPRLCLNNPDCPIAGPDVEGIRQGRGPRWSKTIEEVRAGGRGRAGGGEGRRPGPDDGGLARRARPPDRGVPAPRPASSSSRSSSTRPSSARRGLRALSPDARGRPARCAEGGADLIFAPDVGGDVSARAGLDLRRGAGPLRRPRGGQPAGAFPGRGDGRAQALRRSSGPTSPSSGRRITSSCS